MLELPIKKSYQVTFGQQLLAYLWLPLKGKSELIFIILFSGLLNLLFIKIPSFGYGMEFLISLCLVLLLKFIAAGLTYGQKSIRLIVTVNGFIFEKGRLSYWMPWARIEMLRVRQNLMLFKDDSLRHFVVPLTSLEKDEYNFIEYHLRQHFFNRHENITQPIKHHYPMKYIKKNWNNPPKTRINLLLSLGFSIPFIIFVSFVHPMLLTFLTIILLFILMMLFASFAGFPTITVNDAQLSLKYPLSRKERIVDHEGGGKLVHINDINSNLADWFFPNTKAPKISGLLGWLYFGRWTRGFMIQHSIDMAEIFLAGYMKKRKTIDQSFSPEDDHDDDEDTAKEGEKV